MQIKWPVGLDDLKSLSASMGSNSSLIQATGGNTSLKEEGVLWVKASGKNLAQALQEDIFVPLALAQVLEEIHTPEDRDFSFQPLGGAGLRPSIETTLHALMPHRVVLHSHAIDVIALSLLSEAQITLEQALGGLAWHWIPYCRPGKPLTREIAAALARKPADVLILANHGLVVGGASPAAAAALQAEVTDRLRQVPRPYPEANRGELSERLATMAGARLPQAAVTHSLATDPWSFELAQRNPAYPDHVVFCGVRPWVITTSTVPPRADTAYGLIPGVGVILLATATAATEAMLQAQAEVCLRLPPGCTVNLLSDSQCAELLSWDAEKYRQALEKAA
jgi:rhamnose utilization protein RhaD (predicted bifunctional aldolase and dehydrogenase)